MSESVIQPPASASTPAELYHGSSRRGIEASFRVLIPKEWRPENGPTEFVVIPWPLGKEPHDHLLVLSKRRYLDSMEDLRRKSQTNADAAAFKRRLGSLSKEVHFDRYGRLALSDSLLQSAEIGNEAELIGCVDHFEIWSPTKYAAIRAADMKAAGEVQHQFFV